MILCFGLQKLIFVCGQAVRQTAVAAAKVAGKSKEEATNLGALAVAHFFEKEKKAAPKTMKQLQQRIRRKKKGRTPTAADKAADAADVAAVAALKAAADVSLNISLTRCSRHP